VKVHPSAAWTTLRCAGRPYRRPSRVGCVAVTYACIEVAIRALTVQTGHTGHAAQPQYTDRPSLLRCPATRCSRVSLTRTCTASP
jgi:hypothetical protein